MVLLILDLFCSVFAGFECILIKMRYFRDFGVPNGLSLDVVLRLAYMGLTMACH